MGRRPARWNGPGRRCCGRTTGDVGLDWTWLAADGCIVKAPFGKKGALARRQATGRNPTDRGKPGTKRHLLTEAKGIPVAHAITGANRHDMTQLAALLDGTVIEPAPTVPPHLALDRGYDYDDCRNAAIARGYTAHIPPKASDAAPLPPGLHRSSGELGPYGIGVATVGVPAVASSSSVMIPS